MADFEITKERSTEKYHTLKEIGRGAKSLGKGIVTSAGAVGATIGMGYLDVKYLPMLYTQTLLNQIDHTINEYEIGGLVGLTIVASIGIYLAGSYGISKMKEGFAEIKSAKR